MWWKTAILVKFIKGKNFSFLCVFISGFVCLVILIFGGVVDIGVLVTVLGGLKPQVECRWLLHRCRIVGCLVVLNIC